MRHCSILLAAAVATALVTASAGVAKTQMFLETNEDQFGKGEFEGVVATSLGTLRLGRALESLLAETEGVDYVARLAEGPDGTVYAVTGGAGRIYRVKDGKVALFATLEDEYLFSAAVHKNGDLYVGSGGTKGRIWRVSPQDKGDPKAEVFFEADDVKYVWDLAWLKDGALAAATGDAGKLLRISPDAKAEALIDSKADHVLCLAVAPDGTLYAGTDGEALVYRWADKKSFILYDATESEVTSLAVDDQGNLYVGTSGAGAGRQGGVTIKPKPAEKPPAPAPAEGASSSGEGPEEADEADAAAAEEAPASTALATATKVAETVKAARPTGTNGAAAAGNGRGAAVYRVTPDGIVSPLFDATDDMILALAVAGERLLVGTGASGRVYEVSLTENDDEEARVAAVDPKQVMALLVTEKGQALVGSAGPGRVFALSKGHAKQGTYTSQVYDAGGSARWGAMAWRAQTPAGTELRIATRSGNVREPEEGLWSDWSKGATKSPGRVESPAGRFLQFRVEMKTGNADVTPVLAQIEAAYLRANEPPKVLSVEEVIGRQQASRAQAVARFQQVMKARARSGEQQGAIPPVPPPEGSQPVRVLKWQARDPNDDTLRYDLYFRQQGEPTWVKLDGDLVRPEYAWDTSTVADGWYEVKVVASDRADRPAEEAREASKVSDPVLVDNTAPIIEKVEVRVRAGAEGGEAEVRFAAHDAASRLTGASYTVDSATDWQTIAPTDGLSDAQREEYRFTVRGLKPGPHRLAVRVADEADNRGHAAQTLTVGE